MALNRELLDLLACPRCKGDLLLVDGERGLYCQACRCVYPIKDEIPIMLPDEAVDADKWEGSLQP